MSYKKAQKDLAKFYVQNAELQTQLMQAAMLDQIAKEHAKIQRQQAAADRAMQKEIDRMQKEFAAAQRAAELTAANQVKQLQKEQDELLRVIAASQRKAERGTKQSKSRPEPALKHDPHDDSRKQGKRGRNSDHLIDPMPFEDELEDSPSPTKKPKGSDVVILENRYVVYIIKHSSKLLSFQPSSATLVKVGHSSLASLYSRFKSLQSRAYRVIPELFVSTPSEKAPYDTMLCQLTTADPITDYDELEDVVAVLICDGDRSEAKYMEDQVRNLIGGAPNDQMKLLMKQVVEEAGRYSDLHSYDMVVCDQAFLQAIRKDWIDGRLRTFQDLSESHLISNNDKSMAPQIIQFHLSIARSAAGRPSGRKARSIVGYEVARARRVEDEVLFTAFNRPAPEREYKIEEITVKFEHEDGRKVYKYDGFYLAGQARKWPTLPSSSHKPAPHPVHTAQAVVHLPIAPKPRPVPASTGSSLADQLIRARALGKN